MTTQTKAGETAFSSSSSVQARLPDGSVGESTGLRLVIVDDDDMFRDAAVLDLTGRGFVVTAFADGATMLDYLERGNAADLVVLDWRMPDLGGLDLLALMRERGVELPVVFLTGLNATGYECAALDQGAVDFVDK